MRLQRVLAMFEHISGTHPHMIRKGQLMLKGCTEMSFPDQFYGLAGRIRPVWWTGVRPRQNHDHQWL